LHLDILRDLKRIHSHICAIAYPLLDEAGQLYRSRLKRVERRALQEDQSDRPAPAPATSKAAAPPPTTPPAEPAAAAAVSSPAPADATETPARRTAAR